MTQEQYNRYMDGLVLKVASKKTLNKKASVTKKAAARKLTPSEVDDALNLTTPGSDIMAILAPKLSGETRRHGAGSALSYAMGKTPSKLVEYPMTTQALATIAGTLGGAGVGAATNGIVGAGVGSGVGFLASHLLTNFLRRRAIKNIAEEYKKNPGALADNIDTKRTELGLMLNPNTSWYRGNAAIKAKMKGDERSLSDLMGTWKSTLFADKIDRGMTSMV